MFDHYSRYIDYIDKKITRWQEGYKIFWESFLLFDKHNTNLVIWIL